MSRIPAVPLVVVCLAFLGSAGSAIADPIRVTSGVVDAGFNALGTPMNAEDLQLEAAGFRIATSLEDEVAFVELTTLPVLAPGASIDLSGVLHVEDTVGALVDNRFGLVAAPFSLIFHASPTSLTCSVGQLTECTSLAPFTFDADLIFTPTEGANRAPITRHVIGGGTAQGRFFRQGAFESGAVRYTIEANATPEPATLSLFATGALMALRRRRAGRR